MSVFHKPHDTCRPWASLLTAYTLQVNSFGFGGTNATVILDDAYHYLERHGLRGYHRTKETTPAEAMGLSPPAPPSMPTNSIAGRTQLRLLVWSAADQAGAQSLTEAYRRYIPQQIQGLDDLSYTLAVRRSQFTWRCFAVVDPNSPGTSIAERIVFGGPVKATRPTTNVRIAFVFTGQGAQYLGMGRQLVQFPVFERSLQISDDYLQQCGCQWSVLETIGGGGNDAADIDLPEYSQPLTTCLQIALVDLLRSFAVTPSIVLGHSSGEIAAAYAAGALSHASAVRAASFRGALSTRLTDQPGMTGLSMMAVGLPRQHISPYLDRLRRDQGELNVSVGCINSPKSITLTGRTTELTTLASWLRQDNIFVRMLRVPLAYHSPFMSAIADSYSVAIGSLDEGRVDSGSGLVPMISSVTGHLAAPESLVSAEYWARNLTSPVEFEKAFSTLVSHGQTDGPTTRGRQITHVLEVGPHSALATYVRENLEAVPGGGTRRPAYVPSLVRNRDASSALLQAAGVLYCAGYPVDLLAANALKGLQRPCPPMAPRYHFNHRQSYWAESRLSENFRFRETARQDLLGSRALDWNAQVAQWRNVIRLVEVPWLQDHTIGGEVIFPAAGMLVMAIEGLRELLGAQSPAQLLGIDIRDASFSHPIAFARGVETTETQLTLSNSSQSRGHEGWSHFRLFIIENGSYIECCSGSIRPVLQQHDQDKTISSGPWGRGTALREWLLDVSKACRDRPYTDPYATPLPGSTLRYGPCFQNVQEMRLGTGGFAMAHIDTEAWKLRPPGGRPPAYAIHPTTLDGLAQLVAPALSQNGRHLPTMVPVRLAHLWLDMSSGASLGQGKMRIAAKCGLRGYRGASADIVGTAKGVDVPVVYMDGLETNFISSTAPSAQDQGPPRRLCTRLVWKPDVGLMSPEQVRLYCVRDRPQQPPGAVQEYQSLVKAIFCFVFDALLLLKEHPELVLAPHLQAYAGWMRYQEQRLRDGECPVTYSSVQALRGDPGAREGLTRQLECSGPYNRLFMKVGRSLSKVLVGEVDPLGLIYEDQLADDFYDEMLGNKHHAYPAAQYLDILSFKNPSMKILEVGAGTGGQTLPMLQQLSSDGVRKWARFDYTDISPDFLERARAKFRSYASGSQTDFRVCDISRDPVSQSFEAGTYDLIVASHVLHATPDLDQSLRNVRRLLKPDGRLLLFETTQPEAIHAGFAFGLLRGWWAPLQADRECRSPHSPCLTVVQWDQHLRASGFSGVEIEIPGQEETQCRYSSIIIASVAGRGDAMTRGPQEVALVIDDRVEVQCSVATMLEERLDSISCSCKTWNVASLSTADLPKSALVVFMVELDALFLDGISSLDYERLQSVLLRYKSFLWATRAALSGDPRHHLIDGLGRGLMSEDSTWKLATLSLDALAQDPAAPADIVARLVPIVAQSAVEDLETNWVATREGLVQTSRVFENSAMDEMVARAKQPRRHEEVALGGGIQCSLRVGLPGSHDTVQWTEGEDASIADSGLLGDDEITVEVGAFGLARRDHLVATGHLDEVHVGTDCAGVVQTAGDRSGFQAGDRVLVLAHGTARSTVRVRAGAAVAIHPSMSFAEASSMPTAVWLSYHAVVNVARLQEGESLLVLRGASCVGQMAIQLGQHVGARVMATVSSADKAAFVRDQLGLAEAAVFHESDGLSLSKMYQYMSGAGIDAIVGPLTEEDHQYTSCLASGGRIVDIGLGNTPSVTQTPHGSQPVNTSRTSVSMVDFLQKQPTRALETFQCAMETARQGHFKPPQPVHIFGAGKAGAAFRHLSERGGIGRRVVDMKTDEPIIVRHPSQPTPGASSFSC